MEFPDPANHDFPEVRRVLQSACPVGLSVGRVFRDRVGGSSYRWRVHYHWLSDDFPNPSDYMCQSAKAKFQRGVPNGAAVTTVTTVMEPNDEEFWCVVYKKKSQQKFISFVKSTCCLNFPDTTFKVRDRVSNNIKFLSAEKVSNLFHPLKVFHCGKDVTRKFCKNTRLSFLACEKIFRCWGKISPWKVDVEKVSHEDHSETTYVASSSSNYASSEASVDSGVNISAIENHSIKSTVYDSISQSLARSPNDLTEYTAEHLTYSKICQISKLRNADTLRRVTSILARQYAIRDRVLDEKGSIVSDWQVLPRYKLIPPKKILVREKLEIASYGLPYDDDLLYLYLDFCSSLGQSRSDAVRELTKFIRT